jgi:DNA-binding transcriptional ArsR family regulator
MADNQDDSFNASKAEVFEALGHPTRIRILQELSERPLPFSELKRAAGLESNGLLTFHLGKLSGLVILNPEGAYALTDEGREALRIVEASKNQNQGGSFPHPSVRVPHLTTVLACLVLVLVVLASVSAIEYTQIQGLNSRVGTTPSTTTVTNTVIQVVTQGQLCDFGGAIASSPSAYDTNCQEGLTLSLGIGNITVPSGTNLTISLLVRNDLNAPTQINATVFPLLPFGTNPNNGGYYDYTLPNIPLCGLSPLDAPVPAFVMIFNSSGSPLLLSNPSNSGLECSVYLGPSTYHFGAGSALGTTLSIGGYWSVPRQGDTPLQGISGYLQFSPGKYTLVAFDAFGDSVILPFTVTESPP